jgi:hypothetical protein
LGNPGEVGTGSAADEGTAAQKARQETVYKDLVETKCQEIDRLRAAARKDTAAAKDYVRAAEEIVRRLGDIVPRLEVDTFLLLRLDPHICRHIQVVRNDLRGLRHSMKTSAVEAVDPTASNAQHSKKRKRARD